MNNSPLATLRSELRRIEGGARHLAGGCPFGLPALEAVLPEGGLARGALHEIVAEGGAEAAMGFAATLLAGLAAKGPVLWCLSGEMPYGPGLARLGLMPDRLLLARARGADLLWAMEEGLRAPGLVAVLGEPRALDLTQSRRLQLAAEGSGVMALVLRDGAAAGTTVAMTRWRVAPVPSGPAFDRVPRDFGLMRARWRVRLTRCRGASPRGDDYGSWLVEAGDAAGGFPVAVPLADGSAAPRLRRTG